MNAYRSIRDFDWLMFVLAIAICALGVLQIFSATHDTTWTDVWWKQVVWILAGFVVIASGQDHRPLFAAVRVS